MHSLFDSLSGVVVKGHHKETTAAVCGSQPGHASQRLLSKFAESPGEKSGVPSLPLTWHLTGGPSKRKLIFQVPSLRCHVSGRKGNRNWFGSSGCREVLCFSTWVFGEVSECLVA